MIEKITGRVWKLGDNIDTDAIYPGKYLPIIDVKLSPLPWGERARLKIPPEAGVRGKENL